MEIFRIGFLSFRLLDLLDILLVAFLLYQLYRIIRGTSGMYIFTGILFVYLFWLLVRALNMQLLGVILGHVISVGVLAIIILFQQEVRRFLVVLGSNSLQVRQNFPKHFFTGTWQNEKKGSQNFTPVIKACSQMAKSRTGAIIVMARNTELGMFTSTGDIIDAAVSRRLLENIFYKGSPLHDGAVVIANERILAARCILPISENPDLPARLGMRHRAALGLTEQTDAVVVTVSEETGEMALAVAGEIETGLNAAQLEERLLEEFTSKK